jgi:uncharacterized protein YigE (DUF2233 family)
MKFRPTVFALLFVAALNSRGEWTVASARNEASPVASLVHRQVQVEDTATGESATLELAFFSTKASVLRVIDNPNGLSDLAQAMQATQCLAGVNGGYFDPSFAPLGLRVIDGKMVRPVVRARLMTGILLSSRENMQILRVNEYSARRKAYSAVQCGPLLVDGALPVKGLDRTRMARRTFAMVGAERAALGFCSEVSLGQLSQILSAARLVEDFKVTRALNLDGGSSSAFWFKRSNGSAFSISEYKTVRDFVGIVPKKD